MGELLQHEIGGYISWLWGPLFIYRRYRADHVSASGNCMVGDGPVRVKEPDWNIKRPLLLLSPTRNPRSLVYVVVLGTPYWFWKVVTVTNITYSFVCPGIYRHIKR